MLYLLLNLCFQILILYRIENHFEEIITSGTPVVHVLITKIVKGPPSARLNAARRARLLCTLKNLVID